MNRAENAQLGERRNRRLGALYAWPMGGWLALFFVLPLAIIALYSFMKKGLYGGVEREFSLDAYRLMLNPRFGALFVRTLLVAFASTVIAVLVALPCGYAMARSKRQTLLLILVMVPFWINSLIRVFGWMSILGNNGYANALLRRLGLVSDYARLMYNNRAVVLLSVYMYLPYAILPLFTAIDRFDFSLLEAARDLGATKLQAMLKTLVPNVKGGIVTAVIFTFIPIFGAYAIPLLVGGKDSYMLGNVIVDQVNRMRNWPLASAFSMVLTLLSALGVAWMLAAGRAAKDADAHIADKEGAPSAGAKKEAARHAR